jgi:glycosyltransferase involved in cell wall biosynthesis
LSRATDRRLRVAVATPLPPALTGIADYAAELLPYLGEHLDLALFTDDPASAPAALRERFPIARHAELPAALASGACDLAFYQLGNEASFHGEIYRLLLAHPGVVMLHEFLLHHLLRELTVVRGDAAGFREVMRYCHGATGERAAQRFLEGGGPADPWTFPLFERAVDASLAVIAHNHATRDRVLASRPLADVTVVPHHFDPALLPAGADDPRAARAALGLPQDAFLIGTFGHVTPAKRMEATLAAFHRLRREVPHARLVVVGEVSPHYQLDPELVHGDGVDMRGRVELDDLLRHMVAIDVAVNLRWPSGGETSGTLMRLLGLGKPVVVSNTGSFAEIPDGCCARVDVDWTEEETLLQTLRLLAAQPELRRAMGAQAKRHLAAVHAPARVAAGMAACLERVAAAPRAPRRLVPPLAPFPVEDLATRLAGSLAAAAADLGVGEADEALAAVAGRLVEIGADRWRT